MKSLLTMNITIIFFALLEVSPRVNATAQQTLSPPGLSNTPGHAEYNISEPYKSKALNPVEISINDVLKPLVIASKGKAELPIVCSKESYYREIGQLLKLYLDKATGANFIIVDTAPKNGRAIFIGPNDLDLVKAVFQKAQAMPDEGFIVASVSAGIVLAGNDNFCKNHLSQTQAKTLSVRDRYQSRGTLFAMIDFLERLAGFRFYFQGIGTHIPELSKTSLVIPAVSYSDKPVFDFRALGYGNGTDFNLIKAKPQEVATLLIFSRLADINLKTQFHTDRFWNEIYGKTHPEYFALRADGSRAVGERGDFSSYRCYSSEEGFQAHIAAIDNYYKTGDGGKLFWFSGCSGEWNFAPNKKYIHWSPGDAWRGCNCPNCLAMTDEKAAGRKYSRLFSWYYLKLARECKRRWPDKVVTTYIYGEQRIIQESMFADNPGNLLLSSVRVNPNQLTAAYLKETKAWNDACQDIALLSRISSEKPYLWLHYPHAPRWTGGLGMDMPYMVPHYYQQFILKNKDKISGMLFNGEKFSHAYDSLMLYMMYKIAWNPDFNVDACIDEYCSIMFGPSAKEVGDYYKTVIDRWENIKWKHDEQDPKWNGQPPVLGYWTETYPRKIRDDLQQILRVASSKVEKGSIYYDRVNWLAKGTESFFTAGLFNDLGKVYKYTCRPFTPEIDGLIGEWYPSGMRQIGYLMRNDTGSLETDTVKTTIYMSYDATNIYIAGEISQKDEFLTKGAGVAVARDSNIWAYDSLEIFLSTECDGYREAGIDQRTQYHQIIIDSDGSFWDAYKGDNGVNLNIKYKTRILVKPSRFWFEMAIPFSELRCIPPGKDSKWYINFYWNRPRGGTHVGYAWAGSGGYNDTSRFGLVEFSEK